jgi:hypothetical protein
MYQYEEMRILIWGKTYPELSSKYLETVCTGGVLEDGRPVRLYPIQYRYMDGEEQFSKYQWVTLKACRNPQDARPESYRVDKHSTVICGETIAPRGDEWGKRADIVFRNKSWLFEDVESLQEAQRINKTSLGVVSPREILNVEVWSRPDVDRMSFDEKLAELKRQDELDQAQISLFEDCIPLPMKNIDFIKSRIRVHWLCNNNSCGGHRMQILDWEVAELQRKVGDEKALQAVMDKCDLKKYDLRFFLGNLAQHPTSFTIVGLWYPKKNETPRLF